MYQPPWIWFIDNIGNRQLEPIGHGSQIGWIGFYPACEQA